MSSVNPRELVVIGKISGVFGVQGWVKVFSYARSRTDILQYKPWYLQSQGKWVQACLKEGRAQGKGIVAKMQGFENRDQAAIWINADIAVKKSQLPQLQVGEFYWADLIGLEVTTVDGQDLGQVSGLMETGANDVLVVNSSAKNSKMLSQIRERLIPFVQPAVVKNIDLEQNRIIVDWDPEF